jgi:hypothetical protein
VYIRSKTLVLNGSGFPTRPSPVEGGGLAEVHIHRLKRKLLKPAKPRSSFSTDFPIARDLCLRCLEWMVLFRQNRGFIVSLA